MEPNSLLPAPRPAELPRESDEATPSLIELVADWYWEQDDQFRFTSVSSTSGARSGLDPFADLGHKHWEQQALNLSDADWHEHRARLGRRETFRDFEIQRCTEDGRIVWLSLSGQPVFDEHGGFKGYRGVGRDITAQKRAGELRRLEHAVAS